MSSSQNNFSPDYFESIKRKVWFSLGEAAYYLGITEQQLRNRCKKQLIVHRREGTVGRLRSGQYRFKKQWLDEYLNENTCPKVQPSRPLLKPHKLVVLVKQHIPESTWGSSFETLGD